MGERYYIGYIGAHKSVGYPVGLQDGVRNAVEEQGHILVNIADLLPSNDFIESSQFYFRVVYELASRLDLDAYVVPVGMLNAYMSQNRGQKTEDYIHLLDPGRTVIMEDEFEGYRYVTKDNKQGMRELMRHLIEKHGYRKICFISGPETSFGARERESVYFEEMERAGLPVEEHMFARGIFSGACDEVVEEILYHHPDAEAIACANDHIALTVYRVLKSHGLAPGQDIAVTGFDDVPDAAHAVPPLSTVRLSAYDIAYAAGYEAVRLCEGKLQKTVSIASRFIHRISCGEDKMAMENPYFPILRQAPIDVDALADCLLDEILEGATSDIRAEFRPRLYRLAAKIPDLFDDARPDSSEHLIGTKDLVDIFRFDYANYVSLEKFYAEVSACFDTVETMVSEEKRIWLFEEKMHFQRLITNSMVEKYEQKDWQTMKRQFSITQIASDALLYSDEPNRALRSIFENLRDMGVKEAYLFEFPEPVEFYRKNVFAMGDLVFLRASLNDGEIVSRVDAMRYPLYRLIRRFLPEEQPSESRLMTNSAYTIGGLLSGSEMTGVLILGPSMLQSVEIVRIYYQIAFGLKHLQMIRREKEMITILNRNNLLLSRESERDELTGLYNRRGFMHSLERRIREAENSLPGKDTGKVAALYYMDLDGLKQINDTYGHEEGDFAIKTTAQILEEAFGQSQLVGRQGGDEYLGFRMLRKSDEGDAGWMISHIEEIMNRVNESIDKPYRLEISVGYKAFEITPASWNEVPSLLEAADNMLYTNKRRRKSARK